MLHALEQFGSAYERPKIAPFPLEFREALALCRDAFFHFTNFPSSLFRCRFVHCEALPIFKRAAASTKGMMLRVCEGRSRYEGGYLWLA